MQPVLQPVHSLGFIWDSVGTKLDTNDTYTFCFLFVGCFFNAIFNRFFALALSVIVADVYWRVQNTKTDG